MKPSDDEDLMAALFTAALTIIICGLIFIFAHV